MSDALSALLEALALKDLPRAGWKRVGVQNPESVAGHSWGVSWLVLNLLPTDLSLERALAYAVLHDLAEVRVGDITPYDGVSAVDKRALEEQALAGLCASLPRGEAIRARWLDYEDQVDAEARFVRQLDRLDMALQAARYRTAQGASVAEFLDSAAEVITDDDLQRLLAALRR